tara:strand:- start:252 stop:686 length:435 start_codon:yes stop_codon:yes gene_type:complete
MELSDIKRMAHKDMPIDDTELDMESLKIPQLHNKYLNLFHDEKLVLCKSESDYKTLLKIKWEYYTGKLDQEQLDYYGWDCFPFKILKSDIQMYLDADADLVKLKNKMQYQKEKVSYLESVLKSITNRQWSIRGAIDWRKFINGV